MEDEQRASDSDRDNVASHPRTNCVAGRISLEELEQILERLMAAVLRATL